LSTSIRSVESQNNIKVAKSIFEKLGTVGQVFNRNNGIRMDFKTLESDYDFKSPKVFRKQRDSNRYKMKVESSLSRAFNEDINLVRINSSNSLQV